MARQTVRRLTQVGIVACVLTSGMVLGQTERSDTAGTTATNAQADDGVGVAGEIQQLRAMIEELRQENQTSRAEMRQLRDELQRTQSLLEKLTSASPSVSASPGATTAEASPQLETRVEKL